VRPVRPGDPAAGTVFDAGASPGIALPKGGGAIRGVGETFSANPVTGSASVSVPLSLSPGRGGFGPALTLSYDSGNGNGPFGFGWSLSQAAIRRKTDQGLPRYLDDDTYLLSEAEDLVPVYRQDADGSWVAAHAGHTRDPVEHWVRDDAGQLVPHEDALDGYVVRRYRPRIEGPFARIERWSRVGHPGDVHWRSITPANVANIYGRDVESRITDPLDPTRVYAWLLCESRDDRGNGIWYRYKAEDGAGIDTADPHERNRGAAGDVRRGANRYLKRILYGNRVPLLDAAGQRPRQLTPAQWQGAGWMFEAVFDYGEHAVALPLPAETGVWTMRSDPFSSYRSGFDIRTARLCRRVLMFHHFDGEADVGADCLVRSTDFTYSADIDPLDVRNPVYAFLMAVTQTGYRRAGAAYAGRALPPVEFTYAPAQVGATVAAVGGAGGANLPVGLDGRVYQWTDLHGEGIPGIVTEQAGAWHYSRNLSPLGQGASFAPARTLGTQPNAALADGAAFMDLAGDGLPDLVLMEGATPGLYEHDEAFGWQAFRPFEAIPNRRLADPNARLIDLDGDGHADLLITEGDAMVWHASLAEAGFGPAQRIALALDEEHGPRVVFANADESIHLADMSGDGLGDIVRIRNGEVCYWPNLGHGRFGMRVTMDHAPRFDHPDQFDRRRLLLADIDGSGTTDLIYLHREGVRLYFNQSGNGWSLPQTLAAFPAIDSATDVAAVDLLGNGTACLVWSSPLAGAARRPMQYVALMGDQKPHLLTGIDNNRGAQTQVRYAPSTRFYLQDQRDGKPWLTRLPFPVHVVEQVDTIDHIGRNRFVTRYAYHHGHYDGVEREFRGFGMVEQWDTASMAALADGAPAANADPALHVPPVRTCTWFHTGAYLGGRVSDYFAGLLDAGDRGEYFREPGLTDAEARALLLPDTVLPPGLSMEEEREACRALKGRMLRQEVYAEDAQPADPVSALRAAVPYTVVESNYVLRRLQPRAGNRNAVFFSHAGETITCHYERDAADPRVEHALTLEVDDFGNILKSASVACARRATLRAVDSTGAVHVGPNAALAALHPADRARQTTALVTYTEKACSGAIDLADTWRPPAPCDTAVYELTGYTATGAGGRFQPADLVEPDPLQPGRLRHRYTDEVGYEAAATAGRCRRLLSRTRTLYRRDDLAGLLPLGQAGALALPGETYRLALTRAMLDAAFQRPRPSGVPEALLPAPELVLPGSGGYLRGATLKGDGRFPAGDPDEHWWAPSGRAFYSSGAADPPAAELAQARAHFFLPRRERDPFGNDSFADHDAHDLLLREKRDALGNRIAAVDIDYRVLQPRMVSDPNGNRAAVAFDLLGQVTGTAVMGKPAPAPVEGDTLAGFAPDLAAVQEAAFFDAADPRAVAPGLLAGATTRLIYDLDRFRRSRLAHPLDPAAWLPPAVATIERETHVHALAPGATTRVRIGMAYADGQGREIQRKAQAEPGPVAEGGPVVATRWVGTGWTIYNNKGLPVRQYEPFFSATHGFEFAHASGVSAVLFYDPVQRVVATLRPDHSYEKQLVQAWEHTHYDANDTCAPRAAQTGDPRTDRDIAGYVAPYFAALGPAGAAWQTWHAQRVGGALGPRERDAALRAAAHADTPTTMCFDVLGRPFLTLARNRVACAGHDLDGQEETLALRVELDIQGNERAVRDCIVQAGDPLGRVVTRHVFDMLGRQLVRASMEAGCRWQLDDVAGQPIRTWDSRGHDVTLLYDVLRRPVGQRVRGTSSASDPRTLGHDILFDVVEYGESVPGAAALNLRTRVFRHFDGAGVAVNARLDGDGDPVEAFDFKGNPLRTTRRLASDYRAIPDWQGAVALEAEAFEAAARFDALNRRIQSVVPHSDRPHARRHVIQHGFNEAGLLERVDVWLERAGEPATLIDPLEEAPAAVGVANIDYDARGRRSRIDYKNGASTAYRYDPVTFRLAQLYTRRGAAFDGDCDNPAPPPATIAAPETPPPALPCGLQNLHYTYDAAGNLTHIRDDAQQAVYFRNRRVEPSSDFVHDALYRLIQASGREHLGMVGAPTSPGHGNAFHTRLDHPGDGNALGTYVERYVYDGVGNFLGMQHRGSDPVHAGWTRAYSYEEESLLEPASAGPTKMSNRLTRTVLNPNGAAPPVIEAYGHDGDGNLVRMPHLGGGAPGANLLWDAGGRLCQVLLGGGGAAWYAYAASGERIRKVWEKSPGSTEERIYLGGFELFRSHAGAVSPAPVLERETLHIDAGAQRAALVELRTIDTAGDDAAPARLTRYQFGNHIGSASLELDQLAQVIAYEEYAPYGSTTYQAVRSRTETPRRYRYTGKERDEESGLYYHGARYYAAALGRWTACDPAGPVDGTNLYAYVRCQPMQLVDNSGQDAAAIADFGRQMATAGGGATLALAADDVTVIGAVDDVLIPVAVVVGVVGLAIWGGGALFRGRPPPTVPLPEWNPPAPPQAPPAPPPTAPPVAPPVTPPVAPPVAPPVTPPVPPVAPPAPRPTPAPPVTPPAPPQAPPAPRPAPPQAPPRPVSPPTAGPRPGPRPPEPRRWRRDKPRPEDRPFEDDRPPPPPPPPPDEEERRRGGVFLDNSAMIALAMRRIDVIALVRGRQLFTSATALAEFETSVIARANTAEIAAAMTLMSQLTVVPDAPSARVMGMAQTGAFGLNDQLIFGTADAMNMEIITGDAAFRNAAAAQGLLLNITVFRPGARFGE